MQPSKGAEGTCITDSNASLQLKWFEKFCMTPELVHLATVNAGPLNIVKLLLWPLFQLRSSNAANSSRNCGDLGIFVFWIHCCCAFLAAFSFSNFCHSLNNYYLFSISLRLQIFECFGMQKHYSLRTGDQVHQMQLHVVYPLPDTVIQ